MWFPVVNRFVFTNTGFIFGGWVSLPWLLITSFLTKKGRADLKADYEESTYKRFYIKKIVPIVPLLEQFIFVIMNGEFNAIEYDHEQVLTPDEYEVLNLAAKRFGLAILYHQFLKQVQEGKIEIPESELEICFYEAGVNVFKRMGVIDPEANSNEMVDDVLSYLEDQFNLSQSTEDKDPENIYVMNFTERIIPGSPVDSELGQKRFGTVWIIGKTIQEITQQTMSSMLDRITVVC